MKKRSVSILTAILITCICGTVLASSSTLNQRSSVFKGINNTIASQSETYPYNTTSAQVTNVSIDVLYGIKRDTLVYYGEVPYVETYQSESTNRVQGFDRIPALPGTTLAGTNPPNDAVSATDYWGSITDLVDENGQISAEDLQDRQAEGVESLRVYANAQSQDDGFGSFLNTIYEAPKVFGGFFLTVVKVVVEAKNLDMGTILEVLGLENMADVITSTFIFNSEGGGLSPITGFAIVMGVFAVVGFAISYAKGGNKKIGLKDILVYVGIGLVFIGMCISGSLVSLGTVVSDAATNILYVIAESAVESSQDGQAFRIRITDPTNNNKIVTMQEMCLINKAFIDLQICEQFGVWDIDSLHETKFGDANGLKARTYLYGVSENWVTDFNRNLGYYFWFADSSAVSKTTGNATYPETNVGVAEDKITSMITYLQVCYNDAVANGNTERANHIKSLISNFSNHSLNGFTGSLTYVIFAIILILLAIALVLYGLKVIIAKLTLFIGVLGLGIAGPLMITSKPSLVKAGQAIFWSIIMSLLEITIWSAFFDICIFVTATMISANLIAMLVMIPLLLLYIYFYKDVEQKIQGMVDGLERGVCPQLSQAKRAVKNFGRRKGGDLENYLAKRKRFVKDKDGNVHEVTGGGFLHNAVSALNNEMFTDAHSHKSGYKITSEMSKKAKEQRKSVEQRAHDSKKKAVDEAVSQVENKIEREAENSANNIMNDRKKIINSARQTIDTPTGKEYAYDRDALSAEEQATYDEMVSIEAQKRTLANNTDFRDLYIKKKQLDAENQATNEDKKMSDEEEARLKTYTDEFTRLQEAGSKARASLDTSIDDRATREAYGKNGMSVSDEKVQEIRENANDTKAVSKIIKDDTRREVINQPSDGEGSPSNKEVLQKALEDKQAFYAVDANTKKKGAKKGSAGTVNTEALTEYVQTNYQLQQLDATGYTNTSDVKSDKQAQEQIKQAVDATRRVKEKDDSQNEAQKASIVGATKEVEQKKKEVGGAILSKERREKKQAVREAKRDLKEVRQGVKDDQRELKREIKDVRADTKQDEGYIFKGASTTQIADRISFFERPITTSPDVKDPSDRRTANGGFSGNATAEDYNDYNDKAKASRRDAGNPMPPEV